MAPQSTSHRESAATLLVGSTGIGVTVLAAFVMMTLSLFNGGRVT